MDHIEKRLQEGWRLFYAENKCCEKDADMLTTAGALERSGYPQIPVAVPGNFELDLYKAGLIEDPFFGTNAWNMRRWEKYHVWYQNIFSVDCVNDSRVICFEGIDTVADIYIDGKLYGFADNMFLSHEVPIGQLNVGEHEVVVHIKPVTIYARQFDAPVSSHAIKYMYESLYIRKAAHMYGWDIMPRIVSCGIWKPVKILTRAENHIKDVFAFTLDIYESNNTARLCFYLSLDLCEDDLCDYRIEIEGKCGDSIFKAASDVWHTNLNVRFFVTENCKLWWPKGLGQPNLYDTVIKLYHGSELCDSYPLKVGIRLVGLVNSEVLDDGEQGEFCFKINRKRVFIKGTNWLPLDAFHSEDIKRLPAALDLLDDIGCNMVRCWGGNVYENDAFFDFCDEHGIMIWQDFAMGCAVYPQEKQFFETLEREAKCVVKRLRNHPALVVWTGDNEGDLCYQGWLGYRKNPNDNVITREILPRVVAAHDFTRPFINSSPFVSEKCYRERLDMTENHLWGCRNDYTSDYYRNNHCIFAGEIGFYGMPAVNSLKKFISVDKLWPPILPDNTPNEEWLAHCTSPEPFNPELEQPFSHFVALIVESIKCCFGEMADNLEDFVLQSQLCHAEALKSVIERFRIQKWNNKTGILWWNLINGWPQIDNGVVDYYFDKKPAYDYIKRSQQDICIMMDHEKDCLKVYGSNDTLADVTVEYRIFDDNGKIVISGEGNIPADSSLEIDGLPLPAKNQVLYVIKWQYGGKRGFNHYLFRDTTMDLPAYKAALERLKSEGAENDY